MTQALSLFKDILKIVCFSVTGKGQFMSTIQTVLKGTKSKTQVLAFGNEPSISECFIPKNFQFTEYLRSLSHELKNRLRMPGG